MGREDWPGISLGRVGDGTEARGTAFHPRAGELVCVL